ncbi:MAG: CerR family C-terminal domain-containing protein [Desulfatibacillum sp.]|nr:CerR family C-terminal domain-containing protein [Desulfatibacillum sp.]
MEAKKTSTRGKILDAAGEIFAREGFSGATVREICDLAGTNIASVNYHFGGKVGLYRELCHSLFSTIFDQFPVTRDFPKGTSPEDRLAFFVEGLLNRLLEQQAGEGIPKKSQLLARELAAPSPVMDSLVDEFVRPTAGVLFEIIRQILGPRASERDISHCLLSLVGQCFYYGMARPIFTRLNFLDLNEPGIVEELARHVTRFSLGGMAGIRRNLENTVAAKACSGGKGIG